MTIKILLSDDSHILLKWRGAIIKCYGGDKFKKVQYDPPTSKHKRVDVLVIISISFISISWY